MTTLLHAAFLFPDISPSAFQIPLDSVFGFGPRLVIRWYALAYVAGILLGWYWLGKLNKRAPVALNDKAYENFVVWCISGILLGGRLGYVLFYNIDYYLEYPLEIFSVWKGGMSFHGGMIGLFLAMMGMCKWYALRLLPVLDLIAIVSPIGLFFGRIANFINGELYGRVTDVAWGVIFPHTDGKPRHPSQLYEALLEGVVLFLILFFLERKTSLRQRPGFLTGVFLVGYGLARSIVECVREPDPQIGFLWEYLTMGQLLSLPMIVLGLALMGRATQRPLLQS